MFKRIKYAFRKIVPKKYKTLNQAIMSTPENTKKEIKIAKVGKKYIDISETRQEGNVRYREEKLKKIFSKKRSKLIHTHTGITPLKELPSSQDITNIISNYINYNKDFSAISVMDSVNGKESGRVGIILSKEAKKYIKKNFEYDTLDDLDDMLYDFREHINQRIDRMGNGIVWHLLNNRGLSRSSPEFEKIGNNSLKKMMLRYYMHSLKLGFRFVPMPGYKFNKETLSFEKIK